MGEHLFCGFCGARMGHRWYFETDYDNPLPAFDRESGALNRPRQTRVDVWACPNADLDDYPLFHEFEDHDVVKR